jgi:hypothetical protein
MNSHVYISSPSQHYEMPQLQKRYVTTDPIQQIHIFDLVNQYGQVVNSITEPVSRKRGGKKSRKTYRKRRMSKGSQSRRH